MNLNDDTLAIATLTLHLGMSDTKFASLTDREYNMVAHWLVSMQMRPSQLFQQDTVQLLSNNPIPSIETSRLMHLVNRASKLTIYLEKWLNNGFWLISRAEQSYPDRWKKSLKNRIPPLLFGAGDIRLLNDKTIGIVGSRNITPTIEAKTRQFAVNCSTNNLNVVSGGAKGVDTIAMNAALESKGAVIGILSCDLIKTIAKNAYANAILDKRLVLCSPFHPDVSFYVGNAMYRNKLIDTSSNVVVVMQSQVDKGGTWAGVKEM